MSQIASTYTLCQCRRHALHSMEAHSFNLLLLLWQNRLLTGFGVGRRQRSTAATRFSQWSVGEQHWILIPAQTLDKNVAVQQQAHYTYALYRSVLEQVSQALIAGNYPTCQVISCRYRTAYYLCRSSRWHHHAVFSSGVLTDRHRPQHKGTYLGRDCA